jgi:predicted nucleotidyltransferase
VSHLTNFLLETTFPGKIIFAKIWGSRSFNLQNHDSDWDFAGVYVLPLKEIIGIDSYRDVFNGDKPDFSFYEIKRFCELLLKGNPNFIEMLFTDKNTFETTDWASLKKIRKEFLCKQAVSQYIGYAEGQLSKLRKGSYLHTVGGKQNEKWSYHIIRLLQDAHRIAKGESPILWREGKEREFLKEIREGKINSDLIQELAEEKIKTIKSIKWEIPEIGNKEFLEKWLIAIRMSDFTL